jgi:chemotaxis family two-component system sensor kinase Cph1
MSDQAIRFGEVDLTTCDREPIHIPGSIQPHGVLIVADRQGLVTEQVVGDARSLIGMDAEQAFGQPLSAILDADSGAFVAARLGVPSTFVAPVMRLGVRSRQGSVELDLTIHATDRTVIVELEPARRTQTSSGDPIAQLKTLMCS